MSSGDDTPQASETSPEAVLAALPALAARPDLIEPARGVFRFAQYLLDEEENLTRTGNLTGAARELLRRRTLELLGVESRAPEASMAPDETP